MYMAKIDLIFFVNLDITPQSTYSYNMLTTCANNEKTIVFCLKNIFTFYFYTFYVLLILILLLICCHFCCVDNDKKC